MDPIIEEFRANDGVVGGHFEGQSLLLITTTGAKSGLPRTHALVYGEDGGDLVIVASKGGSPTHPAWYHNLVANPEVTIEVPGETYRATAIITEGEERERLFESMVEKYPFFGEYQSRVERVIPFVRLKRVN